MGRRAGRLLLDALLPPLCLACRAAVGAPGSLCGDCWSGLDFLGAPLCHACGYPLPYDPNPNDSAPNDPGPNDPRCETLCAACAAERPPYGRARAALAYDDASRGLILAFKHGDRLEAAPLFARWLALAGAGLLERCDLVVPVPLHWTRLFSRRYNQSALLAGALSQTSGKPLVARLLLRRRATPSQGRLSRAQRQRNVAGAFALAPDAKRKIAGRRLLLIDDVVTTGATAAACARVLKRGGAAEVDLLALARVVRPQTLDGQTLG
ncbi:MAG: ComF family protein [Geminicoccales bacterium]